MSLVNPSVSGHCAETDLQLILGSYENIRTQLIFWYKKNDRSLPWRLDWLSSKDPYFVWVSEIMLQQTVIKAVIPVYQRFIKRFPTLYDLADADEEQLLEQVRGLGYYRRFKLLHRAAKTIIASSNAKQILWPKDFDAWLKLPGIGEYTASAICSIVMNGPQPVIDGNVERVFCRLLDIQKPVNLRALKPLYKQLAINLLDKKDPGTFNQALMELGQLVCTPLKPNCNECPIYINCLAYKNKTQHLAPQPKIKPPVIETKLRLYVAILDNKVGVISRPSSAKFLKDTLGFLTEISVDGKIFRGDGQRIPKTVTQHAKHLGYLRHHITKHKIRAAVFVIQKNIPLAKFFDHAVIERKLLSNLDRKALKLVLKTIGP